MKIWIGSLAVLLFGGGIVTLALGGGKLPDAGAEAPSPRAEPAAPAGKAVEVAVLSSLAKLRPTEAAKGASRIGLHALRGECESAQIAITAGAAEIAVHPGLEGSLGPKVELRLYQVALVDLQRASGPEGATGRWPDPLIPAVDPWEGEERRAFPVQIPAGESRTILVEACVDQAAAPGARHAAIALSLGGERRSVPLQLRIDRAAVPVTATLPTTFGVSSRRAALGHYGRAGTDEEVSRLDALYRKALLRQRISAHGGTFDPPPFRRVDGRLELDFEAYDREIGPFLEGVALPSGARATTTELRTHPTLRDENERIAYWRAIAAHHRKKGWKALLFDYAHDEPRRDQLPAIGERARLVKKADPSIRVLLTASLDPDLLDAVDVWAPNLNCLYVKRQPDEWCAWRAPLAAYRAAEAKGAALWWYQSCSSHGCNDTTIVGAKDAAASYFHGWPSYVVDAAGSRARAMGWLAFAEDIGGELYWATIHAYAPDGTARDPWEPGALWAFGGNGDGTLFYPGTPARIGGTTHVPIDSLRLHHLRDGLEDYELLRLVAAKPGGQAVARAAARKVAPSPYRVVDDPAAIEGARQMLLDFLRDRG